MPFQKVIRTEHDNDVSCGKIRNFLTDVLIRKFIRHETKLHTNCLKIGIHITVEIIRSTSLVIQFVSL